MKLPSREPRPAASDFALGQVVLYDPSAWWRFNFHAASRAVVTGHVGGTVQIQYLAGHCSVMLDRGYVRPRCLRRTGVVLTVEDLAQGLVDEIRALSCVGAEPKDLATATIVAIRRAWGLPASAEQPRNEHLLEGQERQKAQRSDDDRRGAG